MEGAIERRNKTAALKNSNSSKLATSSTRKRESSPDDSDVPHRKPNNRKLTKTRNKMTSEGVYIDSDSSEDDRLKSMTSQPQKRTQSRETNSRPHPEARKNMSKANRPKHTPLVNGDRKPRSTLLSSSSSGSDSDVQASKKKASARTALERLESFLDPSSSSDSDQHRDQQRDASRKRPNHASRPLERSSEPKKKVEPHKQVSDVKKPEVVKSAKKVSDAKKPSAEKQRRVDGAVAAERKPVRADAKTKTPVKTKTDSKHAHVDARQGSSSGSVSSSSASSGSESDSSASGDNERAPTTPAVAPNINHEFMRNMSASLLFSDKIVETKKPLKHERKHSAALLSPKTPARTADVSRRQVRVSRESLASDGEHKSSSSETTEMPSSGERKQVQALDIAKVAERMLSPGAHSPASSSIGVPPTPSLDPLTPTLDPSDVSKMATSMFDTSDSDSAADVNIPKKFLFQDDVDAERDDVSDEAERKKVKVKEEGEEVSEPVKNTVVETEKAVKSLQGLYVSPDDAKDSAPVVTIVEETTIMANVEVGGESCEATRTAGKVHDDEMASAIMSICGATPDVGDGELSMSREQSDAVAGLLQLDSTHAPPPVVIMPEVKTEEKPPSVLGDSLSMAPFCNLPPPPKKTPEVKKSVQEPLTIDTQLHLPGLPTDTLQTPKKTALTPDVTLARRKNTEKKKAHSPRKSVDTKMASPRKDAKTPAVLPNDLMKMASEILQKPVTSCAKTPLTSPNTPHVRRPSLTSPPVISNRKTPLTSPRALGLTTPKSNELRTYGTRTPGAPETPVKKEESPVSVSAEKKPVLEEDVFPLDLNEFEDEEELPDLIIDETPTPRKKTPRKSDPPASTALASVAATSPRATPGKDAAKSNSMTSPTSPAQLQSPFQSPLIPKSFLPQPVVSTTTRPSVQQPTAPTPAPPAVVTRPHFEAAIMSAFPARPPTTSTLEHAPQTAQPVAKQAKPVEPRPRLQAPPPAPAPVAIAAPAPPVRPIFDPRSFYEQHGFMPGMTRNFAPFLPNPDTKPPAAARATPPVVTSPSAVHLQMPALPTQQNASKAIAALSPRLTSPTLGAQLPISSVAPKSLAPFDARASTPTTASAGAGRAAPMTPAPRTAPPFVGNLFGPTMPLADNNNRPKTFAPPLHAPVPTSHPFSVAHAHFKPSSAPPLADVSKSLPQQLENYQKAQQQLQNALPVSAQFSPLDVFNFPPLVSPMNPMNPMMSNALKFFPPGLPGDAKGPLPLDFNNPLVMQHLSAMTMPPPVPQPPVSRSMTQARHQQMRSASPVLKPSPRDLLKLPTSVGEPLAPLAKPPCSRSDFTHQANTFKPSLDLNLARDALMPSAVKANAPHREVTSTVAGSAAQSLPSAFTTLVTTSSAPQNPLVTSARDAGANDDSDREVRLLIEAEERKQQTSVELPPARSATPAKNEPAAASSAVAITKPMTPVPPPVTTSAAPVVAPPIRLETTIAKDSPKLVHPKKAFKYNYQAMMSEQSRQKDKDELTSQSSTVPTGSTEKTEAKVDAKPEVKQEDEKPAQEPEVKEATLEESPPADVEKGTPKKRSQRIRTRKAAATEAAPTVSTRSRAKDDVSGATSPGPGKGAAASGDMFSSRGRKIIPKERGDEVTSATRKGARRALASTPAVVASENDGLKIKVGKRVATPVDEPPATPVLQKETGGKKTRGQRGKKDASDDVTAAAESKPEPPIKITFKRQGRSRRMVSTIQKTVAPEPKVEPVPEKPEEQEELVPITENNKKRELPQRPKRARVVRTRKPCDIPSPQAAVPVQSAKTEASSVSGARQDESKVAVADSNNDDLYAFDDTESSVPDLKPSRFSRKRKNSASDAPVHDDVSNDSKRARSLERTSGESATVEGSVTSDAKEEGAEQRKPDMSDILQTQHDHLPLKLKMKWESQEAARREREAKEAAGKERTPAYSQPSKESPVAANTAGPQLDLPAGAAPKVTSPPSDVAATPIAVMSPHLGNQPASVDVLSQMRPLPSQMSPRTGMSRPLMRHDS